MMKTAILSGAVILAVSATLGTAIGYFAGLWWGIGVAAGLGAALAGCCYWAAKNLNVQ